MAMPSLLRCCAGSPHSGDLVLSENRKEIEKMSGWTAQESRKGASCKNGSPISWETLASTVIEWMSCLHGAPSTQPWLLPHTSLHTYQSLLKTHVRSCRLRPKLLGMKWVVFPTSLIPNTLLSFIVCISPILFDIFTFSVLCSFFLFSYTHL